MSKIRARLVLAIAASAVLLPGQARPQMAGARAPIVYTVRFPAPGTHVARIEARVPSGGISSETGGAPEVIVSYGLARESRLVTGCWVGPDYAVLNGPSVFITLVESGTRRHEVRLERALSWSATMTGLDPAPGGAADAFVAPDYDTFAVAPIVMGDIAVPEADVPGTRVVLADFGEPGRWDGAAVVKTLARIVDEHRRMMGGRLPFDRYVFLNAMRGGGGGLEHLNSSLLSSPRNPESPTPGLRWLEFASHEFFLAINVKRLRPVEPGPFDYDHVPRTPGLWIAEGLTSWYGDLAVVRAGLGTPDDFLAGISGQRGFTPDEFRRTASEIAGTDLAPFFRTALETTDELDYAEMLDWFGLRFAESGSADPARAWSLEVRPDVADAQVRHLRRLLAPSE